MAPNSLHAALLRPAVIQILRATGFTNTKASVLDTVSDLAAKYLLLLGRTTAESAWALHNDNVPTIQDVRMALMEAGALIPQMSCLEEEAKGFEKVNGEVVPFEDMRGVDAFINWAKGPVNKEIRRVAGVASGGKDVTEVDLMDDGEDYLTVLKKKHSKTGEESRYQGTLLGKESEEQAVTIVGGQISTLQEWATKAKSSRPSISEAMPTPASSVGTLSEAPDTPYEVIEPDAEETL